jgi:hypothetical protein
LVAHPYGEKEAETVEYSLEDDSSRNVTIVSSSVVLEVADLMDNAISLGLY